MKRINRVFALTLPYVFLLGAAPMYAQVSIWNDVNPYAEVLKKGDLIKIEINEKFMMDIDDESLQNSEMKLRLVPDSKYLDFLSKSEQSRGNSKKWRIRSKVKKNFNINIIASVESVKGEIYSLTARKVINVNGIDSIIFLRGITNQRYVLNGKVSSENMAQLVIRIQTRPPVKTTKLQPTNPVTTDKDNKKIQTTSAATPLSEEAKRKILLRYIDEILGAIQND